MYTPDWRLLASHRPLDLAVDAHVERPTGGGRAIAGWIAAGRNTILVTGASGVGKSTELARAASELSSTHVTCLTRVDRLANVRQLTADDLLGLITRRLMAITRASSSIPASASIISDATAAAHVTNSMFLSTPRGSSAVRAAPDEIARYSAPRRVALLIDGLDRLPQGSPAQDVFHALSRLPDAVDLVVTAPWHAVLGGGTEPILRAGEQLHRLLPLDPKDATTRAFFFGLLVSRLPGHEPPPSMMALCERAVASSGGLPRVFLQIIAGAGTSARGRGGAAWPDASDLDDAVAALQDSFRRALLPGDARAVVSAAGTDGRELLLERRARLLAQGVLLERTRGGHSTLEVHPLARDAVLHLHQSTSA